MEKESARRAIQRLYDIRNRFGPLYAIEKRELLDAIPLLAVRTAGDARKLHKAICFIRAFPDTPELHRLAVHQLANFDNLMVGLGQLQNDRLRDSGIMSTNIHYSFSFEVAAWLARKQPGLTQLDWPSFEDTGRLDEIIEHLLEPAESDYFNSGQVGTEEWLSIAAGNRTSTDFDWLMSQLKERSRYERFWTALYNQAEIPLRCDLSDSNLSITANVFNSGPVFYRSSPMSNRVTHAKKEIASPLGPVTRLNRNSGARLIDVAMASLAVRHRETLHFNYANPNEVYLADVGRGVCIAVTGLLPDNRYPLECTLGFLILSNGVPIGYGGASVLFRQVNTGINIFDEYRGSEAAWLWVQVMRVFHSLTGCTCYIANSFQVGDENREALQSGAFWFYYRLGYRPVHAAVRQMAQKEFKKIQKDRRYRTPLATLRKLASCDMHLMLPGARRRDLFDEAWFETTGLLATRQLADTGELSRGKARRKLCRSLVDVLKLDSLETWSTEELTWLSNLSPLIAEADPASWSAREKRALRIMIRAKGSETELDYARAARAHVKYFSALKKSCRKLP